MFKLRLLLRNIWCWMFHSKHRLVNTASMRWRVFCPICSLRTANELYAQYGLIDDYE